jgi:hypothetical protein
LGAITGHAPFPPTEFTARIVSWSKLAPELIERTTRSLAGENAKSA